MSDTRYVGRSEVQSCCLCDGPISGYGHNAQPCWEGRCCDECNSNIVIPTRIMLMIPVTTEKED